MTRRNRKAGHSRDGLFDWDNPATGDIRPTQVRANPMSVPCDFETCRAREWQPCTDHRGRERTAHPTRRDRANQRAGLPTDSQAPTGPPQPRTGPETT